MLKIVKYFFPVFFAGILSLSLMGQANAARYCFCFDDLSVIKPEGKFDEKKILSSGDVMCNDALPETPDPLQCDVKNFSKPGGKLLYSKCVEYTDQSICRASSTQWQADKTSALKGLNKFTSTTQGLIGAFIPKCVADADKTCDDLGVFVFAGLNLTTFLFGIIGALALLMFVYGGFVLILSQGSPEKVKEGTGIMVAAVIGLVIAFGGYLLVRFVSQALGVKSAYILK